MSAGHGLVAERLQVTRDLGAERAAVIARDLHELAERRRRADMRERAQQDGGGDGRAVAGAVALRLRGGRRRDRLGALVAGIARRLDRGETGARGRLALLASCFVIAGTASVPSVSDRLRRAARGRRCRRSASGASIRSSSASARRLARAAARSLLAGEGSPGRSAVRRAAAKRGRDDDERSQANMADAS